MGLLVLDGEYSFNLLKVIQVVSGKHPHHRLDALSTTFIVYALLFPLLGCEIL
jgi:NADH:ubiquinone oxidoreductase subunit 6 (subunit J)